VGSAADPGYNFVVAFGDGELLMLGIELIRARTRDSATSVGITHIPRAICSSHSSCGGPSRAAWLNQDRTFPLLLSSAYRRRQVPA
jgi:hypothetical protein